jgi:hypothetical protein
MMKNLLVASDKRLFNLDQGRNHMYVVALGVLFLILFASCGTDPLIHYGRHFGRTVHALCSIKALITNGLLRMCQLEESLEDTLTYEYIKHYCLMILANRLNSERKKHNAFQKLMWTVPSLEERLMEGSDENIIHIAELVCMHSIRPYFISTLTATSDSERCFKRKI